MCVLLFYKRLSPGEKFGLEEIPFHSIPFQISGVQQTLSEILWIDGKIGGHQVITQCPTKRSFEVVYLSKPYWRLAGIMWSRKARQGSIFLETGLPESPPSITLFGVDFLFEVSCWFKKGVAKSSMGLKLWAKIPGNIDNCENPLKIGFLKVACSIWMN